MDFSINFIEENINLSNEDLINKIMNIKKQNKLEFIKHIINYLNMHYDRKINISEILERLKNNRNENNRNEQETFRNKLIKKYKTCVITGFNEEECEACHINPLSEYADNNCNNGLLLTASLHKTFDKYLWSINPKTSKIETKLKNNLITQYKNKKINLSKLTLNNLEIHYNNYKNLF